MECTTKIEQYWVEVKAIQYEVPEKQAIPEYFRDIAGTFKTWFKITR